VTKSFAALITFASIAFGGALGCSSKPDAKAPVDQVALNKATEDCRAGEVEGCAQACAGGDTQSCNDAGHIYELGIRVPRDGLAAGAYYRKACDAGDMVGCFNAGYLLEHGISGRRDPHCALAMYNYACDGGYARGCLSAGFMYKSGLDITPDPERASKVFKKACDSGNEAACNQLKATSATAPTPAKAPASTPTGPSLVTPTTDPGTELPPVN